MRTHQRLRLLLRRSLLLPLKRCTTNDDGEMMAERREDGEMIPD